MQQVNHFEDLGKVVSINSQRKTDYEEHRHKYQTIRQTINRTFRHQLKQIGLLLITVVSRGLRLKKLETKQFIVNGTYGIDDNDDSF